MSTCPCHGLYSNSGTAHAGLHNIFARCSDCYSGPVTGRWMARSDWSWSQRIGGTIWPALITSRYGHSHSWNKWKCTSNLVLSDRRSASLRLGEVRISILLPVRGKSLFSHVVENTIHRQSSWASFCIAHCGSPDPYRPASDRKILLQSWITDPTSMFGMILLNMLIRYSIGIFRFVSEQ